MSRAEREFFADDARVVSELLELHDLPLQN